MKRMILSTILLGLLAWTAAAQTTEFTYQGNLNVSNSPTTGNYDFEFALFDAVTNGAQLGSTLTRSSVAVASGSFSVKLDFGALFPGANRYLEIRVRQSGGGAFQLLTPRQLINSAPYSIKSVSADNATNATNATTAATATNALQLGGVSASNYLQSVSRNSTLSGAGTAGSPLGVAIPLDLIGNVNGLGLLTVNNSAPNTNAIFASVNGVNSSCPSCAAIRGANTGNGSGVFGTTVEETDSSAGVQGDGPLGNGVLGTGSRSGVLGVGYNSSGNGVYGIAHHAQWSGIAGFHSSTGSAISGLSVDGTAIHGFSPNGWAGYFQGNGFFTGSLGVGIQAPKFKFAVGGDSLFSGNSVMLGNLTVNGTLNAALPAGSGNYIQNRLTQQPASNFNISGNGTIGGAIIAGSASLGTANVSGSANFNGNAFVTGSLQVGSTSSTARLTVSALNGWAAELRGNVYSDGNLALGTTLPAARLDVLAPGGQNVLLGGGNATGSELKLINSGTAHFSIYNSGNSQLTFANTSATTATNTVGSQLMSINSGGDVGIGTTNPGFRLHVNGETRTNTLSVDSYVANNGGPSLCANTSNNRIALCTSSLRYKSNVKPFRAGLELIDRLRPISFAWNEGGSLDIGLGAEDVNKVEPLLTFLNHNGEVEGVKYDRLGVVLINAVKEQQTLIEKLQIEKDNLRKEVVDLRDTMKAQKEELNALRTIVCSLQPEAAPCRP